MLIKVTQKHIRQGKRGSQYSCPIALALKDAGFVSPYVTGCNTFLNANEWYKFPRSAQRFVAKYDKKFGKKLVKPFNFKLEKKELSQF